MWVNHISDLCCVMHRRCMDTTDVVGLGEIRRRTALRPSEPPDLISQDVGSQCDDEMFNDD